LEEFRIKIKPTENIDPRNGTILTKKGKNSPTSWDPASRGAW